MKILITGGAGFIGSHLIGALLNLGHSVIVLDNLSVGKKEFLQGQIYNKKFIFIEADLLDYKNLKKVLPQHIDMVFHLAANSSIQKGVRNPEVDFQNTTQATFNLLQIMRTCSIKKIFYTSGSGVYGDIGSLEAKENFGPLIPTSMYAATKLSAEAMICAFTHLFDMQAWIVRPANVVGPRLTHGVVYDFVYKLRKNRTVLTVLGDGKQNKSYLYVDSVISAILLTWQFARDKINIYNIAADDSITVAQIADLVIKGMNLAKVKIVYKGGYGGWKGDVPVVKLDNTKIKQLGWFPRYTSLQAIQKTLKFLLKHTT